MLGPALFVIKLYYTIVDFNEVDIRIYLPYHFKSLCVWGSWHNCFVFDFSTMNENVLLSLLLLKSCSTLRTFSQVLATVIFCILKCMCKVLH